MSTKLEKFKEAKILAIDCETDGLNPFLGARPFAAVISNGVDTEYLDLDNYDEAKELRAFLIAYDHLWVGHNIKFDIHQLEQSGFYFSAPAKFYDTMVLARLVHNDIPGGYSLDNCSRFFLNEEKFDTVKNYIMEHGLWEDVEVPGISEVRRNLQFHKVPREIMEPYARQDALLTFKLAAHLMNELQAVYTLNDRYDPYLILDNESKLVRCLVDVERSGVRIDRDYVEEAMDYEKARLSDSKEGFKKESGEDYVKSAKAFTRAFEGVGISTEGFDKTDKGNTKFDAASLSKVAHPLAAYALDAKDAKARINFYAGFLSATDSENLLHTSFNQAGTKTGRFSSNSPNLQNLSRPDESGGEMEAYPIRRAIVPYSSDYCLVMIDFDQQEYRLMLDYAAETDLIEAVIGGLDVHQATSNTVGISRIRSKYLNFALLYGAGRQKISEMLDLPLSESNQLIRTYFSKLPKVERFIEEVKLAAKRRRKIFNWRGRMYRYDDPNRAYAAPNALIQGGCGEIMRIAMVQCHEFLTGKKSRISLSVHDELVFNVHKDELDIVPKLKEIMEKVYPYKRLPLTASVSHSWRSLADKVKGPPA